MDVVNSLKDIQSDLQIAFFIPGLINSSIFNEPKLTKAQPMCLLILQLMKLRCRIFTALAFVIITFTSHAQDISAPNFDKIKPEDFSVKGLIVDTTAGAVILADIGKSYFE